MIKVNKVVAAAGGFSVGALAAYLYQNKKIKALTIELEHAHEDANYYRTENAKRIRKEYAEGFPMESDPLQDTIERRTPDGEKPDLDVIAMGYDEATVGPPLRAAAPAEIIRPEDEDIDIEDVVEPGEPEPDELDEEPEEDDGSRNIFEGNAEVISMISSTDFYKLDLDKYDLLDLNYYQDNVMCDQAGNIWSDEDVEDKIGDQFLVPTNFDQTGLLYILNNLNDFVFRIRLYEQNYWPEPAV